MCTDELLSTREGSPDKKQIPPSQFKIKMQNLDGDEITSTASDLALGKIKGLTKIEAVESRQRLKIKNKGVFIREKESNVERISPYGTFSQMQQVFKAKRPELKVVTTEAAYNQMLESAVFPSSFVIEMANQPMRKCFNFSRRFSLQ